MKHFAAQHRIFSLSAVIFALAMILPAILGAVSQTELDDVAAMVTNAKKAPNTIFLIDTSDAMNVFAYSDYIEVCDDAKANAQHAIDICDSAVDQCRSVKEALPTILTCGNINCNDVANGCSQLRAGLKELEDYCDDVDKIYKFPGYPNEDRTKLASAYGLQDYHNRFVGPWNPEKYYDADLCFYDWTKDTNGDVLQWTKDEDGKVYLGGTSEHWSNLSTDTNKWDTVDGMTYYKNTDRRDWDCVTDGHNNMTNGGRYKNTDKDSDGKGYSGEFQGGVSGYWLNWKYTTSLDAVKILLADEHEFSNPPRTRGENECFKYDYYPIAYYDNVNECEEYDTENPGQCAVDPSTGEYKYKKEKICFISPETDDNTDFDTSYHSFIESNPDYRANLLKALKTAVAASWKGDKDEDPKEGKLCAAYQEYKDLSLYDGLYSDGLEDYDEGYGNQPDAKTADESCSQCLIFNNSLDNPAFVDTDCKEFKVQPGESGINREGDLAKYSATYKQICCNTAECDNPKCRDNDEWCYKDRALHNCVLGYYSQYDQDRDHCCDSLECVEGDESTKYDDLNGCKICKIGTAVTSAQETVTANEETVLQQPQDGFSYMSDMSFKVFIESISGVENMEEFSVDVSYKCVQISGDDAPEACKNPVWKPLGAYSCTGGDDATCAENGENIIETVLSQCEQCGYVVKAEVTATGRYCDMGEKQFDISLKWKLPDGNLSGKDVYRKILDENEPYYMILRNETTGGTSEIVNEYECKTAFYHTQAFTDTSSCPYREQAILDKFHEKGYPEVEHCDPESREEDITKIEIGWGKIEFRRVCRYLCRDAYTYDDPWKCRAVFYQMDEMMLRNGLEKCSTECNHNEPYDLNGVNTTEMCCQCISKEYHDKTDGWGNQYYREMESPEGVIMPDHDHPGTKKKFYCAVSAYQGDDVEVGFYGEIINGHIKEADNVGSYLLSPYKPQEGVLYSPYDHWATDKAFITKKSQGGMRDTTISAFKTSSSAERRNVCIYDLIDEWGGTLCGLCSTCSFGCVDDPTISVADDKCAYPSFWIKVPQSDGGELIFSSEQLESSTSKTTFKNKIKSLKAVGGATLGETLYDTWRFLGGMYAMYDPNHVVGKQPYTSPFENTDAACFQNEVVVFSGGQAQFDHNDKISKSEFGGDTTISCPKMDPNTNSKVPCVKHSEDENADQRDHTPYFNSDWYQTSVKNVANFVKTTPFWSEKCLELDSDGVTCKTKCRKNPTIKDNLLGYKNDCIDEDYSTGNSKTVINTIHSGAIGEWVVSELYNKMNFVYLDKIRKKHPDAGPDAKDGKYCSLTLGGVDQDKCEFNDITDVISSLLTSPQASDINSGRPHWTSSLVQPFDVEEKYRGPEAYVAGTVPIAASKSRFWFGNLKKYMIDKGDKNCSITLEEESTCGEWKKQSFKSAADCFTDDDGSDMNKEDFKRLLAGGAAKQLSDALRRGSACGSWPCYKNVTYSDSDASKPEKRKIYYDKGNNSQMQLLKNINDQDLDWMADKMGLSTTDTNKVLDYMYGYDAFAADADDDDIDANRKLLRFGYSTKEYGDTFEASDPIDIDFNQTKTVTIRPLLLGAIVHSKPVAVYYDNSSTTRIFAGANDGMLHAFNEKGHEKWAYIPSNALKSIGTIASATSTIITFNATVDGPITMLHIDSSHDGIINGGEKAYLIFGYRRGAQGYTVIDISDKDNPKFVQNINTEGGYSFGKVTVFRKCMLDVCSYADQLEYYIAVPGGYDDCNDGDVPRCKIPGGDDDEGEDIQYGNNFKIYKFDKDSGKFLTGDSDVFKYEYSSGDTHKRWLISSFASSPFAVNTTGKGAINTEYVYFTDITGTVFRVDVKEDSMSDWTAKVVFATRDSAGGTENRKDLWSNGKSYVGNNLFPPLERYNPKNDPERLPVPVVFGDASWPKVDTEAASMTVFYDDISASSPTGAYSGFEKSNFMDENFANNNNFHEGYSGWRIDFGGLKISKGEKGITEPMITYDVYGTKTDAAKNSYSLAWNTYIPKKVTDCKSFGTSYNYERLIIDGSQAQSLTNMTGNTAVGEWNPAYCSDTGDQGISIATAVGIIATDKGYDLTFGAGADIYRKEEIAVMLSSTRIIKWYELY